MRFGDDGLQDLNNESWGIDNVRVTQGATTIFADNFETGSEAQWSESATDNSEAGVLHTVLGPLQQRQPDAQSQRPERGSDLHAQVRSLCTRQLGRHRRHRISSR